MCVLSKLIVKWFIFNFLIFSKSSVEMIVDNVFLNALCNCRKLLNGLPFSYPVTNGNHVLASVIEAFCGFADRDSFINE